MKEMFWRDTNSSWETDFYWWENNKAEHVNLSQVFDTQSECLEELIFDFG